MNSSQADQFEQYVTNQLFKSLGAIPVLMPIMRQLKLREHVDAHCPGREVVSHGAVAEVLTLNRLMAPQPLYKVGDWVADTVLEEALDLSAGQLYDTRLGRTLDDLHPHLDAIWQDLVVEAILAYGIDLRFLHYDITSVYFEGEYQASDLIDYGYSRDNRPDAKQVNLALNITGEAGVPLVYRVIAGRTADRSTPLENMQAVRGLLERTELAEQDTDLLLISDRAMLDAKVLVTYQDKGLRWLGPLHADPTLKAVMRSVSEAELAQHPLDYRPLNQPADEPLRYQGVLRSATVEHGGRTVPIQVLVVKSRTKAKLDRDHRQTSLERLLKRLGEIQDMLNTRRYKRRDYAWAQIERARRGNQAKRLVEVELTGTDGKLELTYRLNQAELAAAEAMDGRYLLGTNDYGLTALQMLTHYKGQEVAERRIRTVKGPIQVRPLFVEKEERVEGLVFVTMIALLVYSILEMLCRRSGEYITARQVLEKFEHLQAIYLQFSDGSQLKLPSPLNGHQEQLIGLLRFPPPKVYLGPLEWRSESLSTKC